MSKKKKRNEEDPDWLPTLVFKKAPNEDQFCIIHYSDSNEALTTIPSLESWKKLLEVAKVQNHKKVLAIAESLDDGETLTLQYHKRCRNIFTNKRTLEEILKNRKVCLISHAF